MLRSPAGAPRVALDSSQCCWDGTRWWILGWIYDAEREGNPIPKQRTGKWEE